MRVAALVLAAGRGARLGHATPKAYVALAGTPLLVHALARVAASEAVDRVVPVIGAVDRPAFETLADDLAAIPKLADPVVGGAERQDSVAAGVEAVAKDFELVAVHDAARALVPSAAVTRVIAAARDVGAALLALPVRDTVKRVRDGLVAETPPRDELWAAQTPQVFRTELLREALAKARAAGFRATDDAQLVERLGVPVRIVTGDPRNLKITLPEDLAAAEAWLAAGEGT